MQAYQSVAFKSAAFRRVFAKDKLTIGWFVPLESFDGDFAKQEELELATQTADRLNLGALWFQDLGLMDEDFGDLNTRYDSFIMIAHLMAMTKKIVFGTASSVLPFRHPLRLARDVVTLDQLSRGRFILGLSSGDRPYDFPAFGVNTEERAELFRETLEFYKDLTTAPWPEIRSPLGYVAGGRLIPQPLTYTPRIVVGYAQQSMEWIAEHGDGWFYYPRDPATQQYYINQFRTEVEAKHPGVFKPFGQPFFLDLSENPDERPSPIRMGFRTGTKYLTEYLEVLRSIGVNHCILRLVPNGRPMHEILQEVGETVVPHFPCHE